jgi:hypothetical protein
MNTKEHKSQKMEIAMSRSEAKRVAYSVMGGALLLLLGLAPAALGQDPGIQDSILFGPLDRAPILAGLNSPIVVPVYLKTDDSVVFIHVPMATDNAYVSSRNGAQFLPPLSLWDDASFLVPDQNSPIQGYTNQSFVGFAYLFDPRDPQNFLYTGNQWLHIANFLITTTSDISVLGDTTFFAQGINPQNGEMLMGLTDFSEVHPAMVFGSLYFPPNNPPVFSSPDTGTTAVNEQFGVCFTVTATDSDLDNIALTVDFGPTDYTLAQLQNIPGLVSYRFCWVPSPGMSGTYPLTFIVNDGNGGVVQRPLTLVVSPTGLEIAGETVIPGATFSLPVSLYNGGRSSAVGGFEILVTWPPAAISLNGVTRSGRTGTFEFFRVNYDDSGPGTARIVGLADMRNGVVSPPLQPGTGPIFFLEMSVSPDESLIGVSLPVSFLDLDNTDNTLSDSTGYLLIHPQQTNGIVHVMGPDEVLTGDINLNGIPYEIADATLFVNHLTNPVGFPFNSIQREASDINADGLPETVADLVYLLNIVANIIPPPPTKFEPVDASMFLAMTRSGDRMMFSANSEVDLGAVLVRIAHQPGMTLEPVSDGGFTLAYNDDGSLLSVLVYMPEGGGVPAGNAALFSINTTEELAVSELQASDAIGHLLNATFGMAVPLPTEFAVPQNYPNPFNARTAIKFELPTDSDVTISVYNIAGQVVKTFGDHYAAGRHQITWDASDAASGVYFARVSAGNKAQTVKMTLLK